MSWDGVAHGTLATARCVGSATVLWLASPALAASYYVNDASTANDVALPGCATMPVGQDAAGCGTCALPCLTPQYAYANNPIAAGDTIYLNAGTWLAPSCPNNCSPLLALTDATKAGAQGAPVTVKGAVDGGQLLTVLDGNLSASGGIDIRTSWITVDSVVITNLGCDNRPPYGSGVFVTTTSLVGIEARDVEVSKTSCATSAPIDFESSANPCTGCRIVGCRLHDNEPAGGVFVAGAGAVEVRDNQIWMNARSNAAYASIVISGTPNAIVAGNLVHDNGGPAISIQSCCGKNSTGVQILNNTLVHDLASTPSGNYGEVTITGASTGTIFENNLVVPARLFALYLAVGNLPATSDYNELFPDPAGTAVIGSVGSTQAATLAAWQTQTSKDTASLSVDPRFVSATDFHLRSQAGRPGPGGTRVLDVDTSPLVDLGDPATPIGSEPAPNGGRVNAGAFGGTVEGSSTPASITIVSGDNQTGLSGQALALPLEVRVASGSYSEPGVVVSFAPAAGAGLVAPSELPTDANGRARTTATLGAPGPYTFTAVMKGLASLGSVTFSATAVTVLPDAGADGGSDAGSSDAGLDGGGSDDAGVADAGADDAGLARTSQHFTVGCGCATSSGNALLALALVIARWRRRTDGR